MATRRGKMRASLASWIAVAVGIVAVSHFYNQPWPPRRIAGAALCLAAMVMLSVARYQLGRSFSVRARASKLITTGIYAYIRNPIYFAGELFLLGSALFLPSWIPLVLVVITIPIQVLRARKESSVLRAAFGAEYEAYRRTTWF